jgi:hypothetical protein
VLLEVAGRRTRLVGRLPIVVGRVEGDVLVRGASVSRRHCALDRRDGALVVRDLGSRNGTLVGGVAIAGEVALGADATIGLGAAAPDGTGGLTLEVLTGLDRGLAVVAGPGALRVDGLAACVSFAGDAVVLTGEPGAEVRLGAQRCVLGVALLVGDEVDAGGVRVVVAA